MKGLLIAEKPSVMRAIQEVYTSERGSFSEELEFGAFHGHLMALKKPEDYNKAWEDRKDTSVLPIIPDPFAYYPKDKESVRKLMDKIKKGNYDFLINACDAGREGELIFWSFYETMGLKHPVKRFWASSVTKPAIKKALLDLQPASSYEGLRQAAKYRAQFDWLVGMNFTRAASASLHQFIPVGRVQTPTLKLVVDRELEIKDFKVENFFEVKAIVKINGSPDIEFLHMKAPDHKSSRFKTEKEAAAIVESTKNASTGKVLAVKEKIQSVEAPTLYSLAELQKAANKYLKFKPDKTLSIAQNLYEGGFLSYPRTESRFLPTDMIPEIEEHLASLNYVPTLKPFVLSIGKPEIDAMLKKNYINDAGITDHHAIIPTDTIPQWDKFSKDEQAVYELVAKSFLAIFLPPYKAATSSILIDIGGNWFLSKGKREIEKGYGILYPSKAKDIILPACKAGDGVSLHSAKVSKGSTKPPQRYSPGSLLNAMQNAGQDLPDSAMRHVLKESAGLGTSATRAEILKKLEERGFISLNKNAYYATAAGISLIENVGERDFSSALLTAQWERKLQEIENNSFRGNFEGEMESYIREETDYLLSNLKSSIGQIIGKCPECGGNVIDGGNVYICQNRNKNETNSCSVWMPKQIGGYQLTEEDITALLAGEKTAQHAITKKDGSLWEVRFSLNNKDGLSIESAVNDTVSVGSCPICGKKLIKTSKAIICERHKQEADDNCPFWMPRIVGGYELSAEDVSRLLSKETIGPYKVKTKQGSTWSANFRLNEKFQLKVSGATIGVCPICKKPVFEGAKNFYCQGGLDGSCNFTLSKEIKDATITAEDMKTMLDGKKTRIINFLWANGNRGNARLYMEKGTLRWEFEETNK